MHPEVKQNKAGNCPICSMKLVPQDQVSTKKSTTNDQKGFLKTYKPLFIIVGLILLSTLALTWHDYRVGLFDGRISMQYFMAGFFLVFSALKLLDVAGFAEGYSTYDLLASRVKEYGYIYPFIELGLGLAYLVGYTPVWLIIFTAVLMVFSGIGVAIKVAKKEKFKCACLGTFIDVPLTNITLIEDFGMAAMALFLLLQTIHF